MTRAPASAGALAAASLHAAVLAALLSYEPARTALLSVTPIMVDWIAAPKAEPARELPEPKPVVHKPKPVEKPQIVAAPPESPSPIVVPAPPPPPPEPVAATPAPAPEVVAPIFNASYLQNPKPPYPLVSQRLHEEGHVVVRVLVNANGAAEDVQLRTSSGFTRLDESVLQTVKRWKFIPARRGADAVPAWVLVPITFKP